MRIYGHDIIIEHPAWVFGDGTHETTRFLLYFLNKYIKGKSYVDAGCGTGILSVFAMSVGATSATAFDADIDAVECTIQNAKVNGVSIEAVKADIKTFKACADVVTQNIARRDAEVLLPYVAEFVKEGGLVITTWYKELPKDELTNGFEIIDCIEGIDYDCYVLKKR